MKTFTHTITKHIKIDAAFWRTCSSPCMRFDCSVCGSLIAGCPWVIAIGSINGKQRGMRLCYACGCKATDEAPPAEATP